MMKVLKNTETKNTEGEMFVYCVYSMLKLVEKHGPCYYHYFDR